MRVLILPGDRGGCGLYRMLMPGRAVAAAFPDVEVYVADGINGQSSRDAYGRVTIHSIPEIPVDLVVMQRPLNDDLSAAIPLIQAQGIAVVVELDDDFKAVSRRNAAAVHVNPATSPRSNWDHLQRACDIADLVTVSTPRLTRYAAAHGRVRVVRNYVPAALAEARPQTSHDGPLRLGWTGTVATHPDDLKAPRGAVQQVLSNAGAVLSVIGDGKGVQQEFGLDSPPHYVSGWVDLEAYPQTVIDSIDVGMVPLEMSAFNEAKSYLKGLEFSALGIPWVASPTSEYRALASHKIGLLAERPRDWSRHLSRLLHSADMRAEMGARGREVVAAHYTIEQHAHEWYDAWTQAMANRDARYSPRRIHAAVG